MVDRQSQTAFGQVPGSSMETLIRFLFCCQVRSKFNSNKIIIWEGRRRWGLSFFAPRLQDFMLNTTYPSVSGRTKAEAFEIGQKMAEEVTNFNPKPVKLKFEKVPLQLFFNFLF